MNARIGATFPNAMTLEDPKSASFSASGDNGSAQSNPMANQPPHPSMSEPDKSEPDKSEPDKSEPDNPEPDNPEEVSVRLNAIAQLAQQMTRSTPKPVKSSGFMPEAPGFKRTPAAQPPLGWIILVAIGVMVTGLFIGNHWVALAGSLVALLVSVRVIWRDLVATLNEIFSPEQRILTVSIIGFIAALIGLLQLGGVWQRIAIWSNDLNWDAIGASGEVVGAIGQILIAILAVYVAWRQYVISKDLTIQQNIITQQQTIDAYFQGISDLVLDEEGLLEDLPLERAIAEGRTAAILSSVDANGKAKVLRFLSQSRLLTPLKRDGRLGRAILDGMGGYAEDRDYGTRVIDLGVMLAGADLAGTDLRWTDLSDMNLIRSNLSCCDLVKTNFARTILYETNLAGSDVMGTRFFYGAAETATPRTRDDIPNYKTGEFTGAVVENADFSGVQRMSDEQRYYCCAWGGAATRSTIPGGCETIPNRLGK